MTNNINLIYQPPTSILEKLTEAGLRLTAAAQDYCPWAIILGGITGAAWKALDTQKVKKILGNNKGLPTLFAITGYLFASIYAPITIHRIYDENVRKVCVNKKIKKIVDQSLGNSKSALIIRADLNTDHSGVFATEGNLIPIKLLAETHSIKCVHGYSDALKFIETDVKNSQKYDLILVQGHGNRNDVTLDSNGRGLRRLSQVGQILKENGKIILDSCSTGKGEHNIAQDLSIRAPFGAAVYAARCPISTTRIDKNGNAQFSSWPFGWNDPTHIYQNGKLIFSSLPTQVSHEKI